MGTELTSGDVLANSTENEPVMIHAISALISIPDTRYQKSYVSLAMALEANVSRGKVKSRRLEIIGATLCSTSGASHRFKRISRRS